MWFLSEQVEWKRNKKGHDHETNVTVRNSSISYQLKKIYYLLSYTGYDNFKQCNLRNGILMYAKREVRVSNCFVRKDNTNVQWIHN